MKNKLKVALIIEIDEKDRIFHNIGEVKISVDGEIKKAKKPQTMDVWVMALLSCIVSLTHTAHQAGLINSSDVFKECINVLTNGFINPDWETKVISDTHQLYLDFDESDIYSDPISFSNNEKSFLFNLIHQKPHFNECEAEMAKTLFDYFGYHYTQLPDKVISILEREK